VIADGDSAFRHPDDPPFSFGKLVRVDLLFLRNELQFQLPSPDPSEDEVINSVFFGVRIFPWQPFSLTNRFPSYIIEPLLVRSAFLPVCRKITGVSNQARCLRGFPSLESLLSFRVEDLKFPSLGE